MNRPILLTLVLLAALGAIFLKGFREAVGLAVPIVVIYLFLNVVLVVAVFTTSGLTRVVLRLEDVDDDGVRQPVQNDRLALLLFPKLALGLSGFETGVAVMPLVQGRTRRHRDPSGGPHPQHAKLLTTAALIMSVMLDRQQHRHDPAHPAGGVPGGRRRRNGRALAYLAHEHLGDFFGTIYDISTDRDPVVRRRVGHGRACSTSCPGICRATAWRPIGRRPTGRSC